MDRVTNTCLPIVDTPGLVIWFLMYHYESQQPCNAVPFHARNRGNLILDLQFGAWDKIPICCKNVAIFVLGYCAWFVGLCASSPGLINYLCSTWEYPLCWQAPHEYAVIRVRWSRLDVLYQTLVLGENTGAFC